MHDDDPLLTLGQAARRLGLDRSLLYRQLRDSDLPREGRKIRLSAIVAERERVVNLARSHRWAGISDGARPTPERLERARERRRA